METILYYYLLVVTKFKNFTNSITRYITDTEEVKIYQRESQVIKDIRYKYYFVKLVDNLIRLLKSIRSSIDIKTDKIQVVKSYPEGSQTIILDSEILERESVSLTDMIKHISNKGKEKSSSNGTMFIKCELHDPPNKPICLKKFLLKYKDNEKYHHHTLRNIIYFNRLKISHPDSYIKLSYFENKRLVTREIPLKDITDNHISHFWKKDSE